MKKYIYKVVLKLSGDQEDALEEVLDVLRKSHNITTETGVFEYLLAAKHFELASVIKKYRKEFEKKLDEDRKQMVRDNNY